MDIGSMRQRITIQESQVKIDAIGNHTIDWVDWHSCFAYVNLSSGKEHAVVPETISEDTLIFIIRWCQKLRALDSKKHRISYEGRIYNITLVDDVQFRHEKLKLTATKEVRG